jgi:hypothetical protein
MIPSHSYGIVDGEYRTRVDEMVILRILGRYCWRVTLPPRTTLRVSIYNLDTGATTSSVRGLLRSGA